mgnify:CR=1 FL=1|jgi:F-box domain.
MDYFDRIPTEVLFPILCELNSQDIENFSSTYKRIKNVCESDHFWKLRGQEYGFPDLFGGDEHTKNKKKDQEKDQEKDQDKGQEKDQEKNQMKIRMEKLFLIEKFNEDPIYSLYETVRKSYLRILTFFFNENKEEKILKKIRKVLIEGNIEYMEKVKFLVLQDVVNFERCVNFILTLIEEDENFRETEGQKERKFAIDFLNSLYEELTELYLNELNKLPEKKNINISLLRNLVFLKNSIRRLQQS